jgi:hypothetical protein
VQSGSDSILKPITFQSHAPPPDPAFRDFLSWLRLSFSTLRLTFSARWRVWTFFTCSAEGSFFMAADEADSTHWCNCMTMSTSSGVCTSAHEPCADSLLRSELVIDGQSM